MRSFWCSAGRRVRRENGPPRVRWGFICLRIRLFSRHPICISAGGGGLCRHAGWRFSRCLRRGKSRQRSGRICRRLFRLCWRGLSGFFGFVHEEHHGGRDHDQQHDSSANHRHARHSQNGVSVAGRSRSVLRRGRGRFCRDDFISHHDQCTWAVSREILETDRDLTA